MSIIPCQSQESLDIRSLSLTTDSEALVRGADETISIMSFSYSSSTKSYEATAAATSPVLEETGFISVFISFDNGEEFLYLPHSEEDVRSLRRGPSTFVYEIDLEGLIKVSIQNPQGGTPWSTLDMDQFTVRVYESSLDLEPYQEKGLDLEDEIVFGMLTDQYQDNYLTVW